MPAKNISFIIPTLNEAAMLTRLLDSIKALKVSTEVNVLEIIVVDAASTDGTADLAIANACQVVQARPGKVAASRNLGAAAASGDTLAFIDADCELPRGWLLAIAKELQENKHLAVGAVMAPSQLGSTWVERAWFELAHRQHGSTQVVDVDWLATFNIVVRRSAFEQVGGFDATLATCEDVEFGYRLSSIGTLRRLNDNGVVHHGESKTVREFYRREAWRARGAIGIVAKHWRNPREFLSFVLPFVAFGILSAGLLAALLLLLLSTMNEATTVLLAISTLLLGLLPVALLTLRRRIFGTMFLPCTFLLIVYFYARCLGTVRPFVRIERTSS